MTKRIVILTGSELRHEFVRRAFGLARGIEVVATFCERTQEKLDAVIAKGTEGGDLQTRHLDLRMQSECDFFQAFVKLTEDGSHPRFVARGDVNSPPSVAAIEAMSPDLLIAYGCSIVREPLLSMFQGRFFNVHLGLSPYYRGSGTNFWPLVNGEPEYVGATFMHIDAGVDTGEIIHQVRAEVRRGDSPHSIGNRLIAQMTPHYIALVQASEALDRQPQPAPPATSRYYRKKDFTPESVVQLYERFSGGLVDEYQESAAARCLRAPIVDHPAILARLGRQES